MIRPKVGWKYHHKLDESLVIEIIKINRSGDWDATVRWPDGQIVAINAALLGHYWRKM